MPEVQAEGDRGRWLCCHSGPSCKGPLADLQDRGRRWASDLPDLKLKAKNLGPHPCGIN